MQGSVAEKKEVINSEGFLFCVKIYRTRIKGRDAL
jgi:hypothetical protein